jgi:hypothetical protein
VIEASGGHTLARMAPEVTETTRACDETGRRLT